MLEALNGILFHQLANNPNVVYAVLRSSRTFEELGTFTLRKGLEEVRRVKNLKEEDDKKKASRTGKSTTTSGTGTASEKAGLLQSGAGGGGEEIFDADVEAQAQSGGATTGLELTVDDAASSRGRTSTDDAPEAEESSEQLAMRMSEKARGKMRERSSSLDDDVAALTLRLDPELERIAAAGVGRNGFVPTQEWVCDPANSFFFFTS